MLINLPYFVMSICFLYTQLVRGIVACCSAFSCKERGGALVLVWSVMWVSSSQGEEQVSSETAILIKLLYSKKDKML